MLWLGRNEFENAAALDDDVELARGVLAKAGDGSAGTQRGPIGQFGGLSSLVAEAPNPALAVVCKEVEALQGWNRGTPIDVAPGNRAALVVGVLEIGRDKSAGIAGASI